MDKRIEHYESCMNEWIKDKNASMLIIGGGINDIRIIDKLKYQNVTITNINESIKEIVLLPTKWALQDANELKYNDNSFDYVIANACLHHFKNPHGALTEMYRVAKSGLIFIESRDSITMRILTSLKFTQEYETAAVFFNGCKTGGLDNSDIPNYVYRWTEREVEKTIKSYAPFGRHIFNYKYGYDIPHSSEKRRKKSMTSMVLFVAKIFYPFYFKIFKRQQNMFACFIEKPNLEYDHYEWLKYENGTLTFNREWAENIYSNNYLKKRLFRH